MRWITKKFSKLKHLSKKAARSRRHGKRPINARILALLIVLAAGYDVITTNANLAVGNVEANSLIAAIQSYLGNWWSVPKILLHLGLASFVLWLPTRKMIVLARVVVVGYALIVVNNSYHLGWTL